MNLIHIMSPKLNMQSVRELDYIVGSEIEEVSFVQDYLEIKTEFGIIRLLGKLRLIDHESIFEDGEIQFEHKIRKLLNKKIVKISYNTGKAVKIAIETNTVIGSMGIGYEMMHFFPSNNGGLQVWD